MKRERSAIDFWPVDVVKRLRKEGKWYKLLKQRIRYVGSVKEIEFILIAKRNRMIPASKLILRDLLKYQRKRKVQEGTRQ